MLFITADQHKKLQLHSNSTTKNTPFCKASTHQGDTNLFDPCSVGHQCLPNSSMACMMSAIQEPSYWTTGTMDYILYKGDKLYQTIDTEEQLLLPSDLPTCVTMCNKVCHIITGKEAYGSFVQNITETKIILSALCTLLQRTTTSALVCLGDKTGSSTIALLISDTSLFVFDSHSRDENGMPCPNGTAVLMKFENVHNTVSYICQLAHELSASLFHLTFYHAQTDVQCECKTKCDTPNIRAVGILLHDEILQLHTEYIHQNSQHNSKGKHIMHHTKRKYDNQKQFNKQQTEGYVIKYTNRGKEQMKQCSKQ